MEDLVLTNRHQNERFTKTWTRWNMFTFSDEGRALLGSGTPVQNNLLVEDLVDGRGGCCGITVFLDIRGLGGMRSPPPCVSHASPLPIYPYPHIAPDTYLSLFPLYPSPTFFPPLLYLSLILPSLISFYLALRLFLSFLFELFILYYTLCENGKQKGLALFNIITIQYEVS